MAASAFGYKKKAINGELRRVKQIASNFQSDAAGVTAMFLKAGFHGRSLKTLSIISLILVRKLSHQGCF